MSTARALTALARDACARARLVFARGTATDASSSSSSRTVRHRFAVVGSGPAGMYAALALAKTFAGSTIDVFDRSPAPFGLVRYGVAPDHAETKLVTKKFHETLTTREDVAYYGNVGLGRDVSVGELMDGYHGVVLACGASGDRRLEVPGEETRRGVLSAREFVAWFNGDPAHGPESETHARVRAARRPPGAYPKVLNRFSRREASLRRAGRRVARGGRFDSLIPIRSSRTSAAGDDAKAYRATWRKPASRGRFRRPPRDPRRTERSCVKRERRGACWNERRKRAKPNSGEAKTILRET